MSSNEQALVTSVPPTVINDSEVELVLANVFEFYGTLDRGGSVIALRGRIFQRTSADPALLTGQPFSQTVFWQSSSNTPKLLDQAIEKASTGETSELSLDFRVSAEEKVPLDVVLQPLGGEVPDRIFVCARAAVVPIDEGSLNNQRSQLLFAAENAEIGLWFWDFAEDKISFTPRSMELLGLPTDAELTFDRFLDAIHPDDRESVNAYLRQAQLESSKYEYEFRVVYPDGSTDWLSVEGRSFLSADKKPVRMVGVLRKITKQKQAAEELARVYDREKIARDEAVEANRSKDVFLAFVSHELRSHLNPIVGWSKILLTKPVDETTQRSALETIERSARVQAKLINDLVDSARVASGKLRLEYRPANLAEIVRVAFQAQKPAADAHDLNFTFTTDNDRIYVYGDAGRLQQVFNNLLSNAIKFTPAGGKVDIVIESDEKTAVVRVKDTGQGISADQLPHIFRQFAQADNMRSNSGLGLGLSIVKVLVAKHGGTVEALSDGPGKGAEFVVRLPLRAAELNTFVQRDAATSNNKPLHGLRIMVVEDDNDSREVLQLFLEQSGAYVLSAESARVGIDLLKRSHRRLPDVIISDLAMPEQDGYSMLSEIRSLPANEGGRIPALALSAFTTVESKQRALESGFQKYLTKPFEPDLLVADLLTLSKKDS